MLVHENSSCSSCLNLIIQNKVSKHCCLSRFIVAYFRLDWSRNNKFNFIHKGYTKNILLLNYLRLYTDTPGLILMRSSKRVLCALIILILYLRFLNKCFYEILVSHHGQACCRTTQLELFYEALAMTKMLEILIYHCTSYFLTVFCDNFLAFTNSNTHDT